MSTDEQNLLSCLIAKRLGVGNHDCPRAQPGIYERAAPHSGRPRAEHGAQPGAGQRHGDRAHPARPRLHQDRHILKGPRGAAQDAHRPRLHTRRHEALGPRPPAVRRACVRCGARAARGVHPRRQLHPAGGRPPSAWWQARSSPQSSSTRSVCRRTPSSA